MTPDKNGDTGGEFPGVTVTTSSPKNVSVGPENEFIHLDNSDEVDESACYTIYTYTDEDRYDELEETISDLRKNFILATGIILPPWMRDEMPLETDVLLTLERAIVSGNALTPELLESIQNETSSQEGTNGC